MFTPNKTESLTSSNPKVISTPPDKQEASIEEKTEEQKAPSPIQRVVGSLKGRLDSHTTMMMSTSPSPLTSHYITSPFFSVKGVWGAVLSASKMESYSKVKNTKDNKIGFNITEGTGKVSGIVGAWESLFVQTTASVDEVNATIRAANIRIKDITLSPIATSR